MYFKKNSNKNSPYSLLVKGKPIKKPLKAWVKSLMNSSHLFGNNLPKKIPPTTKKLSQTILSCQTWKHLLHLLTHWRKKVTQSKLLIVTKVQVPVVFPQK